MMTGLVRDGPRGGARDRATRRATDHQSDLLTITEYRAPGARRRTGSIDMRNGRRPTWLTITDLGRQMLDGMQRPCDAGHRSAPGVSCCGAPSPLCCANGGEESDMTSPELSRPPPDRPPLDASVVRAGVLAMLALIVGSMFTYELVRSTSPSTLLPRPRPSASGAASVIRNVISPVKAGDFLPTTCSQCCVQGGLRGFVSTAVAWIDPNRRYPPREKFGALRSI
jgi:hypothetical protein